jgi:transcriptional regulator GlxA family with amidase domain
MDTNDQEISNAIEELKANLSNTSRVEDWAELMGYNCPKKFARRFLRYYSVRPIIMLEYIRLESITSQLRKSSLSNFEIARQHGIPDEIALNKFINYHIGCSPTEIKRMSDEQFRVRIEKFGSKIRQ